MKQNLNLGRLSAVAKIAVKGNDETEVDLDKLFSLKQVRQKFSNLEELAESIRINGIIEPLVVHAEADGRYRIIVGERRFRAASIAGLSRVPVVVKRNLSDLAIRRIQVTENNDRDNLTVFDEAMGVIDDVETYGVKEAMIIWNRSEGWISKRVAVQRYAKPVVALLENDMCGDLELLHSLNQLYVEAADSASAETTFNQICQQFSCGQPVSRNEVRQTVAIIKQSKQKNYSVSSTDVRTNVPVENGGNNSSCFSEQADPVMAVRGEVSPAGRVAVAVARPLISAPTKKASYEVLFRGGVKPDEWESSMTVKAVSVRDALDRCEVKIHAKTGQIYAIAKID